MFLTQSRAHVEAIDEALGGGHAKEAEQRAHSLRGSASQLGATQLQSIAAEIEARAAGGDLAAVSALLPALRREQDVAAHALTIEAALAAPSAEADIT